MLRCKLGEILEERNMTRYQLAQLSGVSEPTIGRMANNFSARLDFKVIAAVMEALELEEIGDLLCYEPPSKE